MEPPRKRTRLSFNDSPDSPDDFDLQSARAQNDQKLKSLFEGIFEKYGRDFSGIGDEIDLRTGEIVVNKGHVLHMEHEDDTGEFPKTSPPSNALSQFIQHDHNLPPASHALSIDIETANQLCNSHHEHFETNIGLLHKEGVADVPEQEEVRNHGFSSPSRTSPGISRADDPLWQVPEIDANFWTPSTKETPRKTYLTPRIECPNSPPTAPSVWAIRTPGRPRGSTLRHQTGSSNKNSGSNRLKRKRKARVQLDWSFAQRTSDASDSDDPLQERVQPSSNISSNCSVKVRGRTSVPPIPKRINFMSSHEPNVIALNDDEVSESGEIRRNEEQDKASPIPDTPRVRSSSPAIAEDTPTQKSYVINADSPIFIQQDEVILTPDEVKLIVQFKSQYLDMDWEEFVDHLPGRTVDDLQNWADHHPYLLKVLVTTSGWSRTDLENLHKLASQSGIWWRDFQTVFPHRSRAEIEAQVIRLWSEKHSVQADVQKEDQDIKTEKLQSIKRKPSRIPYSDENDPALKTGEVMANDDLEVLLEDGSSNESDNDWSEISAFDFNARKAEKFNNTPRKSPEKGFVPPRKLY